MNIDNTLPNISDVSVDSGPYSSGEFIDILATFNESVIVDTRMGRPRIALDINGQTKYAEYQIAPESSILTFRYIVDNTVNDSDGIIIANSIDLNSGTIQDRTGNNALLALPALITQVVIDTTPPVVLKAAIPGRHYRQGNHLDISIDFSESIIIDSTRGIPQIPLTIGSHTRYANYHRSATDSKLIFRYTILEDDEDDNGIDMARSIVLNGGTILDVADNAINLNLPLVSNLTDIIVDNQAPTIVSATVLDGEYRASEHIDVLVEFSEEVSVDTEFGNAIVVLNIGENARYANYHSGSGESTLIFRYTVVDDDNDNDGIAMATPILSNGGIIQDLAGNTALLTIDALPNLSSVIVDNIGPTIIDIIVSKGDHKTGEDIEISVSFSEGLRVDTTLGTPRMIFNIGTVTKYAEYSHQSVPGGNDLVFTYSVISGDKDEDGIDLVSFNTNGAFIQDMAGNNADTTFAAPTDLISVLVNASLDATPPTIDNVVIDNGNYMAGTDVDIKVYFSENVTVDTTNGTPRIFLIVGNRTKQAEYQSGTGSSILTFRYTVDNLDNDADGVGVAAPIDPRGGTIRDGADNDALLSFIEPGNLTGVIVNFTEDVVAPTILDVTLIDGHYAANEIVDIFVRFSEKVTVDAEGEGGIPQIALTVGDKRRYANYQFGHGTSTLVFRYIPLVGDYDNDGIEMAPSILPNGGVIQDETKDDADLSFTIPQTKNVLIDGVSPRVLAVKFKDGHYTTGEIIEVLLRFDEDVIVDTLLGTPQISLSLDGEEKYAKYKSGSGTSELVFSYTIAITDRDNDGVQSKGIIDLNGGSVRDNFGNNAIPFFFFSQDDIINVFINKKVIFPLNKISGNCAVVYNGQVKCWESDSLIANSIREEDGSFLSDVVQISAGGSDSYCVLTQSGGVKCWYNNSHPVDIVVSEDNQIPLRGITQISTDI